MSVGCEHTPEQGFLTGLLVAQSWSGTHTCNMTPTSPQRVPLSPMQHSLVASALRQAAALELALGHPEVAGRWLLEFIDEEKQAKLSERRTA